MGQSFTLSSPAGKSGFATTKCIRGNARPDREHGGERPCPSSSREWKSGQPSREVRQLERIKSPHGVRHPAERRRHEAGLPTWNTPGPMDCRVGAKRPLPAGLPDSRLRSDSRVRSHRKCRRSCGLFVQNSVENSWNATACGRSTRLPRIHPRSPRKRCSSCAVPCRVRPCSLAGFVLAGWGMPRAHRPGNPDRPSRADAAQATPAAAEPIAEQNLLDAMKKGSVAVQGRRDRRRPGQHLGDQPDQTSAARHPPAGHRPPGRHRPDGRHGRRMGGMGGGMGGWHGRRRHGRRRHGRRWHGRRHGRRRRYEAVAVPCPP